MWFRRIPLGFRGLFVLHRNIQIPRRRARKSHISGETHVSFCLSTSWAYILELEMSLIPEPNKSNPRGCSEEEADGDELGW